MNPRGLDPLCERILRKWRPNALRLYGAHRRFTPCHLLRGELLVLTLFWGVLAYGAWQIAAGLYAGPNFTALHRVTVEDVGQRWGDWVVNYHYTMVDGRERSAWIHVVTAGEIARARAAQPGSRIELRIPVSADDPKARFGLNKQVQLGLFFLLELGVLTHFFRHRDPLQEDPATGKWAFSKLYPLEFLVRLFGVMMVMLWLDGLMGIQKGGLGP